MKIPPKILITLAVVVLAAGLLFVVTNGSDDKKDSKNNNATSTNNTPESMADQLKSKTGDEFDAAFIDAMVEHHTLAVAMAQQVDTEAKNSEIKTLADQIISSQSKEITDMKDWGKMWGYTVKEPTQASIDAATMNLKGKTGDDLDKTFITEMIAHHESAIAMANLVNSNAKHQELKTLGGEIIAAQTKEIADMKAWAKMWNYQLDSGSPGMPQGH